MNYLFPDFETYFDDKYTLSGPNAMPIDNYVLDPRFYIHGVSLKVNDEPSQWFTGNDIAFFFRVGVDMRDTIIVAHNNYFDGFIASQIYGLKPAGWLCTMCMGRGLFGPDISQSLDSLSIRLGGKGKSDRVEFTKGKQTLTPSEMQRLASYSITDNDECARCFFEMTKTYPKPELDLIDLTLRMFLEPRLELDLPLLEQFNKEEIERKNQALQSVEWVWPYISSGQQSFFAPNKLEEIKNVLMSDQQFEALLKKLEIKVPHKTSKKTGQKTTAFSKADGGFKKMLKSDDERISQLANARLAVKSTMGETRSQAFLEVGNRPLPVQLLYFGNHTGRWSGQGGRNLQNLMKGSPLRKGVKAPKGYRLAKADSSQIEARLTAYIATLLAGTECLLLKWFREGLDPYCEFGTMFYGRTITKEDQQDRFVSKQAVLGLGFQMWVDKFQWQMKALADLDFDMEFCTNIVTFYRETFPEIKAMWYTMQNMLEIILNGGYRDFGFFGFDQEGIRLPSGLHVHYNQLKVEKVEKYGKQVDQYSYFGYENGKKAWVNLFGGKVAENLIQALDRQIVAEQMLVIRERYPICLQEHDGVVVMIPEAEADEGIQWIVDVMHTPPVWAKDFPVAAEGKVSERYG